MRRALCAVLLLASCRTPPAVLPDTRPSAILLESAEGLEIARLEDARSLGGGRVEALTRSPAPGIRIRAFLALARLQEPITVGVSAAGLIDPEPEVRAMAAFALGELGLAWEPVPEEPRSLAEQRLLDALRLEKDALARDRMIEALGKVGSAACLETLLGLLDRSDAIRERAAIALGVLAKNSKEKVTSPRAVPALTALLKSDDERVRFAGGYGLARMKDPTARGVLQGCLSDVSPLVRGICARGLADVGIEETGTALASLLNDPDERVAAEAARSIAHLTLKCTDAKSCSALYSLLRSTGALRIGVVEATTFEPVAYPPAAEELRNIYNFFGKVPGRDDAERSTSARAQCLAALAHDRIVGKIELLESCGKGVVDAKRRGVLQARALSEGKGNDESRLNGLLTLSKNAEPSVRAAAADGLGGLSVSASQERLLALIADPDSAVAATAAEAAAKLQLAKAGDPIIARLTRLGGASEAEAIQSLLGAAGDLKLKAAEPRARELLDDANAAIRSAAAAALTKITGQKVQPVTRPVSPGAYASEEVPARAVVKLTTSRGILRVRLFVHDAPMTVKSFVSLVRKGFYDGLTFHRVVPNFVTQGGDPKGDGSGGPGYAIRCEVNPHRFEVGTMGMALSGKDTGGSQFFFTHSPQPHLDGRYTTFGELIEGVDLASAMVEGDQIVKAELER